MSLGKRPRQPMKRTTSMTEITFDLAIDDEDPPPSDGARAPSSMSGTNKLVTGPGLGGAGHYGLGLQLQQNGYGAGGGADPWDQRLLAATVSPRLAHRRQSCDVVETSHFLRSCSLCKRRLVPGRDIYMYRGDSAFCSLECRQQQMTQDERKDNKCSMVTSKKEASSAAAAAKGKTTVAAAAAV